MDISHEDGDCARKIYMGITNLNLQSKYGAPKKIKTKVVKSKKNQKKIFKKKIFKNQFLPNNFDEKKIYSKLRKLKIKNLQK